MFAEGVRLTPRPLGRQGHPPTRAITLWTVVLLLITCAGCKDETQGLAVERVQSFISDLASGRYASAADQIRTEQGAPLTEPERSARMAEWRRAYGDGTRIHLTRFDATSVRASTRAELPAAAVLGFQVVFSLDGTSTSPCFVLPNPHGTERAVLVDGRWFVVPDALNTLRPPPNCSTP